MAAIDAMESIISRERQGKREKAKDEERLKVIKSAMIGDAE